MIAADLDAELAALEAMALVELRRKWVKHVKAASPKVSAGLLRLALAHHLQSKAHGGVTPATERRLRELAQGRASPALRSGTRLIREWRGKVHVVAVTEEGRFRWRDQDWTSLSEIAREITGTRWSGPAFFGTKPQRRRAA